MAMNLPELSTVEPQRHPNLELRGEGGLQVFPYPQIWFQHSRAHDIKKCKNIVDSSENLRLFFKAQSVFLQIDGFRKFARTVAFYQWLKSDARAAPLHIMISIYDISTLYKKKWFTQFA